MAHLQDGFSVEALPVFDRLAALVMVFDMNDVGLIFLPPLYYFFVEHLFY